MILDKMAKTSKRFSYAPTEVAGDFDVYAAHRGNKYLIATIRNRVFKRVSCEEWKHRGVADYLPLIQSYAGLNALESGRTGPL